MRANTKIIFEMFDTDSKINSTPVCTQSITDVTALKNEKPDISNYATTEPSGFYLDGSYKVLQDDLPAGLYSNKLSDENGTLTDKVVLTVNFGTVISSNGITLYFPKEDYPKKLSISWYYDSNLQEKFIFYPDNSTYFCQGNVAKYNKIVITFYSTSVPGHRIKLCGIDYGKAIVFDGNKIVKSSTNQEIDLLCDEIAVNTLEFEIEDKEGMFSVVSDNSVFFAAQENQRITVYTTINSKEECVGEFYLTNITAQNITVNFKAQDIIGVLEGDEKVGDKYYNVRFDEFCTEILAGYKYSIEGTLKRKIIKGYLPLSSKREALQQACFAIGAVVDTQGGGEIKIFSIAESETQLLGSNQIFSGGRIESIKTQKAISILAHNFTQTGDDSPVQYTRTLNERAQNTISVQDAVFVNQDNVESVMDRLEYYYNQQVLYKIQLPLKNYLKLGKMFMAYMQKNYIKGNLQSVNINLSGGLTAELVIRGYVFSDNNKIYLGEIFTGERGV